MFESLREAPQQCCRIKVSFSPRPPNPRRPKTISDQVSPGAGIVFGPEAQEYFAKHVKINRQISVPSHLRRTLDRDGKVISENDQRQEMVSWDMLYNALRS